MMVSMMLCESSGNGTLIPVARLISRTLRSKHVEHDSVDRVVGAIEEACFDFGRFLAEAVDPALTLLQSVRDSRAGRSAGHR